MYKQISSTIFIVLTISFDDIITKNSHFSKKITQFDIIFEINVNPKENFLK